MAILGGTPPNRDGKRLPVGFPGNIKKPQKPPKWNYLIPVYIGILRILGFSKTRSLDRGPKMLQKFAPDFWGILTPPGGVGFSSILGQKQGFFLEFVGESLPRWYFRGQRYKAPLKGYRCFFGPAVGGLTERVIGMYARVVRDDGSVCVYAPQSAFRDDRIGRSRKVIPQGYGHPGG